ncbi:MAG: P-loop NTPase fold protein [Acidobacteriota bacterium]
METTEILEGKTFFLNDLPDGNDEFEVHTSIAITISKLIQRTNLNSSSFTLGLFGTWGSGKSFIINKVKNLIENGNSETLILYVDVWKFIGTPLMRSILFEIDKELRAASKNKSWLSEFANGYIDEKRRTLKQKLCFSESFVEEIKIDTPSELYKEFQKLLSKYRIPLIIIFTLVILSIVSPIFTLPTWLQTILKYLQPINYVFSNLGLLAIIFGLLREPLKKILELAIFRRDIKDFRSSPTFSPEEFEDIFKNIVERITKDNKRLVIVFDNIDRCDPHLAYEVLTTIKTYMDIKKCFYIIPCDDEAIKYYLNSEMKSPVFDENGSENNVEDNGINSIRSYSQEFLDKLFQTYIRMPILKESDRDKFIKHQFEELNLEKLNERDIDRISEILFYAYQGLTPRQIKRFINDFATYYYLATEIETNEKLLTDDIQLFAAMIAIKQRWYAFETEIIKDPDVLADYYSGHTKAISIINKYVGLNSFLQKISGWVNLSKSLRPYIYLKNTSNEIEIQQKLLNRQSITGISKEDIRIITNHINNLLLKKNYGFLQNALATIVDYLSDSKENSFPFKIRLINLFWETIIKIKAPEIKLPKILDYISFSNTDNSDLEESDRNLITLVYTLHHVDRNIRSYCEEIFVEYLTSNEITQSKRELTFDKILELKDYYLSTQNIQKIFSEYHYSNKLLNGFLRIMHKHSKIQDCPDFVQTHLVDNLSTSPFQSEILDILEIYGAANLKEQVRKDLVLKFQGFVDYLFPRKGNPSSLPRETYTNCARGINLLYLKDFDLQTASSLSKYANIMDSLFRVGMLDEGISLLYNSFRFLENENICNNAEMILINYFNSNEANSNKLYENNIDYLWEAVKNEKIKNVILSNKVLSSKIYNDVDLEVVAQRIHLFIATPLTTDNLLQFNKIILERIHKSDSKNVLLSKISKYLVGAICSLLKVKANNVGQIFNTINKFNLPLRDYYLDFKKYNNFIVDYVKVYNDDGMVFLKELSIIYPRDHYIEDLLFPLFRYLKNQLESTNDISKFSSIGDVLVPEISQYSKIVDLIISISDLCLENGQTKEEYELAVKFLAKLNGTEIKLKEDILRKVSNNPYSKNLKDETKNIVISLIGENDISS